MEAFALPYLITYCQHLKQIGIKQFCIHFCGDQNKNLPILAEANPWPHPAILSFGQEVDIVYAATLFPQDIIYGNIDTILMEKGSPREVFDTCKELLEKGKRIENGFILAPGCSSPVFTPPVNMYAMTKAVEEHGIYWGISQLTSLDGYSAFSAMGVGGQFISVFPDLDIVIIVTSGSRDIVPKHQGVVGAYSIAAVIDWITDSSNLFA